MTYRVPYVGQGRQPGVLGTGVTFTVLSILAVSLRFYSRARSRAGLWYDDWCILLALPLVLALNADVLYELSLGIGAYPNPKTAVNAVAFYQSFYAAEILYDTALVLIKISVLTLFYRLFPIRTIRVGFWILLGATIAWFLGTIFVIIFQCTPIERAWNMQVPGKCVSLLGFYLGQGIPSIVTDFALFCMPIRVVWHLQMPVARKLAILGIFMVGFVAVLGSILRLVFVVQGYFDGNSENLFYASSLGEIWTVVELNLCLICSCLPSLRPALSHLIPSFRTVYVQDHRARPTGSTSTAKNTTTTSSNNQSVNKSRLFTKLPEDNEPAEGEDISKLLQSGRARGSAPVDAENGIEMDVFSTGAQAPSSEAAPGMATDGIHLTREIDVFADRVEVDQ